MNKIKLIKLKLKNFKGIKNFTLDADGEGIKVFGDNATGKTTLYDAFLWLLFNKDSQNKTDFAIKTVDDDGKEIHGLEHEVEAVLLVDKNKTSLKKVFREKWTKKRGSATSEMTGHTTDYFINNVPSKKKEYDEFIADFIDEDIFKLLTNPAYFNEQMKWQDRRKVLLEVCGDLSDEEVISSNKDLHGLAEVLNGNSIEQHKKIIASRKKKINDQLDRIPVRIDEINHNLPDVSGLNKKELENKTSYITSQIEAKQDEINNIKNGNAIAEKNREIQEIEINLLKIKQDHESMARNSVLRLQARLQEEESNINILKQKLHSEQMMISHNDSNIRTLEDKLISMRKEWALINAMEFEHKEQCECPTCGQSLPEKEIEATRDKALKEFNLKKSTQLEEVIKRGKTLSEEKKELQEKSEALQASYDKLTLQISEKEEELSKLKDELQKAEKEVTPIEENPSYIKSKKQKEQIENEILTLQSEANNQIQSIEKEILQLREQEKAIKGELNKFIIIDQSQKRIKELEQEERALAEQYEQLEKELFMTEEFTRTKVNMLEERINSKFKYARFKLFETQVNGGLKEVCETTYKGVPYSKGLNNASRINIGLDIINTLSSHYELVAPIFVDNAEAVTKLIDVNAQVISLVVSEQDKKLRIESKTEKEVA